MIPLKQTLRTNTSIKQAEQSKGTDDRQSSHDSDDAPQPLQATLDHGKNRTRPDGPGRVDNVDGADEPIPIDGDDGCENIDDLTDLEVEKERDEEQKRKAEEEDKKKEDKKKEEKKKDGDWIKIFTVSIPAITLGYQLQLRLDDYRIKRYDDEDDDNDNDEPEGGYKATARKEAGEVPARQGPGGDSSGVVCSAEI
ncbi:hypothetical protein QC762_605762 [Podospora pseudocomata]|uniref:Uncharacterized protein n=1 Tax=Podospora pseudocomata TaxID=2093779 RepID=A0ABR0G6L4_9PEZI|nr:hypothetical protein QC762_605762 [Podospora pseudocomata]